MANTASSFQFFDTTKGAGSDGSSRASATVIGQDVVFKGNLKSGSDVVIAGIFEGDVTSEGRVTIVAGAQIVGSIAAAEVVLGGRIQGNSVASKAMTLLGTADVRGDVTTPQIVIEPGATFVGRCSMPKGAA